MNNALKEELDNSTVAKFATNASDGKTYQVEHYNLDMIITVGYRIKSKTVLFLEKSNANVEGHSINQKSQWCSYFVINKQYCINL